MAEVKTVAELNKEIARLKKLLETGGVKSEVPKTAEAVKQNEEYMQQPVKIKLFKDSGRYKEDVYVAVNDKCYLIRRGETVTVPRCVEQALKNSLAQDEYAAALVDGLVQDYACSTQN